MKKSSDPEIKLITLAFVCFESSMPCIMEKYKVRKIQTNRSTQFLSQNISGVV
jgi:hypothetical protein